MNPNLIFQLVELAISLAQSQLDGGDLQDVLLDIIHKGIQAYEEHTGDTLNPGLIGVASRI